MRVWIAMLILAVGIMAARAISPAQQEIIFGKNSAASGSTPGGTCTGAVDASAGCPLPMIGI